MGPGPLLLPLPAEPSLETSPHSAPNLTSRPGPGGPEAPPTSTPPTPPQPAEGLGARGAGRPRFLARLPLTQVGQALQAGRGEARGQGWGGSRAPVPKADVHSVCARRPGRPGRPRTPLRDRWALGSSWPTPRGSRRPWWAPRLLRARDAGWTVGLRSAGTVSRRALRPGGSNVTILGNSKS